MYQCAFPVWHVTAGSAADESSLSALQLMILAPNQLLPPI